MAVQDSKQLDADYQKAKRELARLRAKLEGRDQLLRRIRAQQQWAAEALEIVHVPLLAFNDRGSLFWLNEASRVLLGLTGEARDVGLEQLPENLRTILDEKLTSTGSQRLQEAALKLHGQGYRLTLQYLARGAAAATLIKTMGGREEAHWLVSLVPEHGDIVAQELGYPDLPEVSVGEDGGSLEFTMTVADHSGSEPQDLVIGMHPVLALEQFLGIEQLARIQYQAVPSCALDLALIQGFAERIISDRLGPLQAGAWMMRLSTDSLHNRDFATALISILNKYKVNGGRFVFGLPEAEVMDALVLMRQLQADLATTGVRWALLETSADLNNFVYLAALGLDFYCVSPDLVAQAAEQERAKKVLSALHQAAAGQGMATLATGVDSADMMAAIRSAGVDYASGSWANQEAQR